MCFLGWSLSRPSSRAIACPAAEAAPDAPKVQNKYRAESAGIARPDVMEETPTPGRTLIKAWVRDWMMLLGFVRYDVRGTRARYNGAAAMTIAPEGLTLWCLSVGCSFQTSVHSHAIFGGHALCLSLLVVCHYGRCLCEICVLSLRPEYAQGFR